MTNEHNCLESKQLRVFGAPAKVEIVAGTWGGGYVFYGGRTNTPMLTIAE